MKSFNLELTTVAMGGPGEYQESWQHEKRALSAKVINKVRKMAKIRNLGNISKGLSQQRLSTKEGRRQRSESIQSSTTPDPEHHIQPYQPMFPLRADQELYYSVPEHLVNSKSYGSVLQRCVINKWTNSQLFLSVFLVLQPSP